MSDNDRQRFERIYRDTYGRVLAYALRRTNPELAKDAVAETFLVAWRRLDRLPPEPLPWLLAAARRVLANQRRARMRLESLRARLAAASVAAVTQWEFSDQPIADALTALSPLDQEALLLVAWDGLTSREAAAVMGVSAGAFRIRLHRARRRIQARLDDAPSRSRARLRRTDMAEEAP